MSLTITLHKGDLLEATTQLIVNSANSQGVMSSGVAGAIKKAGGSSIESEVKELAPISVGQAVITTAGDLSYEGIIHAPTMKHPSEPIPAKQVELATIAALRIADDKGYASVAFPAMGTGAGDVAAEEAARIMMESMQMYMVDNQLSDVHIYLFTDELYEAFQCHE